MVSILTGPVNPAMPPVIAKKLPGRHDSPEMAVSENSANPALYEPCARWNQRSHDNMLLTYLKNYAINGGDEKINASYRAFPLYQVAFYNIIVSERFA